MVEAEDVAYNPKLGAEFVYSVVLSVTGSSGARPGEPEIC